MKTAFFKPKWYLTFSKINRKVARFQKQIFRLSNLKPKPKQTIFNSLLLKVKILDKNFETPHHSRLGKQNEYHQEIRRNFLR